MKSLLRSGLSSNRYEVHGVESVESGLLDVGFGGSRPSSPLTIYVERDLVSFFSPRICTRVSLSSPPRNFNVEGQRRVFSIYYLRRSPMNHRFED